MEVLWCSGRSCIFVTLLDACDDISSSLPGLEYVSEAYRSQASIFKDEGKVDAGGSLIQLCKVLLFGTWKSQQRTWLTGDGNTSPLRNSYSIINLPSQIFPLQGSFPPPHTPLLSCPQFSNSTLMTFHSLHFSLECPCPKGCNTFSFNSSTFPPNPLPFDSSPDAFSR